MRASGGVQVLFGIDGVLSGCDCFGVGVSWSWGVRLEFGEVR